MEESEVLALKKELEDHVPKLEIMYWLHLAVSASNTDNQIIARISTSCSRHPSILVVRALQGCLVDALYSNVRGCPSHVSSRPSLIIDSRHDLTALLPRSWDVLPQLLMKSCFPLSLAVK